eukprot:TRINITY_DN26283_c0_g1_i2.p1 TRINITY_DN26283_c0_g1~~TRINITY_DN26283_c0_g1_i2.p1  ORF type:complete len:137 (+),score=60.75 TRINITY_DN26283_c0_g1_i2:131-541(+)
MIRRPPRSTLSSSSAASDVYKRQEYGDPNRDKMAEEECGPAMVKLVSGDGMEFLVEREAAMVSGTIKNMLSSPGMFVEASGEIKFPEIKAEVLEKVCQYMFYKLKYTNSTQPQIPEFEIEPELALSLLMAANYLDA